MGSSSKNTNSTTNQSTASTTTPNVPSYATNSLQNFTNNVDAFGNIDPSTLVAPQNSLQQQANSGAAALPTVGSGSMASAVAGTQGVQDAAAPSMQATSLLNVGGGLQSYMNPYTQDVVNSTLANYDQQAGQTEAQQAAQAAGNNAFGGSRYGVQSALTQGQLALGRASTQSGLLNTGFNDATTLANEDADRQQAADTNNLNSENTSLARTLAAAGQQGQLGATANQIASNAVSQQGTTGAAAQATSQAQDTAGLSQLQAVGSLLGMGQFGLQTGSSTNGTGTSNTDSTTTSNGSILDDLSGLAGLAQGGTKDVGGLTSLASLF